MIWFFCNLQTIIFTKSSFPYVFFFFASIQFYLEFRCWSLNWNTCPIPVFSHLEFLAIAKIKMTQTPGKCSFKYIFHFTNRFLLTGSNNVCEWPSLGRDLTVMWNLWSRLKIGIISLRPDTANNWGSSLKIKQ